MYTFSSTYSVSQSALTEIRPELERAQVEAQDLAHESLSANTRRLYESNWRGFLTLAQCPQAGNRQLSALPATDETQALSVGAHVYTKSSTLARRVAAIQLIHRWPGHKSPFEKAPGFTVVYTGYKHRRAQRNPSKPLQGAATESIVQVLVDDQQTDTLIGLRNRALLLVGYDAALRRSELVGLNVEHLTIHSEGMALHSPSSKSDQDGQGSAAYLLARPESPYCPVRSVVDWMNAANINQGAVFRRLHRRGTFLHLGVERLSDKAVYRLVKNTASDSGISGCFGAHSLRRRLITSALQNKHAVGSVQAHARHMNFATTSRYHEAAQVFKTHPGKSLLRQKSKTADD